MGGGGDVPYEERRKAPSEYVRQTRLTNVCRVQYVQDAIEASIEPVTVACLVASRLANLHVCRMLSEKGPSAELFCGNSLRTFYRECFNAVGPKRDDPAGTTNIPELGESFRMFRRHFPSDFVMKKERRLYYESVMMRSAADKVTTGATTALRTNLFRRARSCVRAFAAGCFRGPHAGSATSALEATVNETVYQRLSRRKLQPMQQVDEIMDRFNQKLTERMAKKRGRSEAPTGEEPPPPISAEEETGVTRFIQNLWDALPETIDTKKR